MKQTTPKFFSANELSRHHYLILTAAVAILGCILSIKFGRFLYIQYDAYYYAAAADAFINTFTLADNTTIPPEAIRTPQNGIIFLHFLLDFIGIHNMHTRLLALACVNGAMMVACAWLVTRLCLLSGIDKLAAQLTGLSMVLSFYFYAVLLQQINDMTALFLSLSALVLMLDDRLHYRRPLLLMIAITLPLFRLSGILVFASAALAAILLRDRQRSISYSILTMVSVVSPALITVLLNDNTGGVSDRVSSIVSSSTLEFYLSQLWHTLSLSIPEAFFRMSWFTMNFTFTEAYAALTVSLLLLLALSVQTWSSFITRNHVLLILCISVWSMLAYFQLYHAQPTRYIIMAGVLLAVIVIRWLRCARSQRIAAGLYVGITLLISSAAILYSPLPKDAETKHMVADVTRQLLARLPMPLFSYFPRVSYFLAGQQSYRDIASACAASGYNKILVITPKEQLSYYMNEYQDTTDNRAFQLFPLGYEYRDYQASTSPLPYFGYERVTVESYVLQC